MLYVHHPIFTVAVAFAQHTMWPLLVVCVLYAFVRSTERKLITIH